MPGHEKTHLPLTAKKYISHRDQEFRARYSNWAKLWDVYIEEGKLSILLLVSGTAALYYVGTPLKSYVLKKRKCERVHRFKCVLVDQMMECKKHLFSSAWYHLPTGECPSPIWYF